MLKKISNILVILIVLIPIIDNNIYSQEKPYKNKVIKVGFYDYNPYFYIDKGNPTGYYNDILDTICNDLGIEYEYKYTNILQAMSMLKNGDLDLLIGINRTEDRVNEFEFTDSYITLETYGIYTNKCIEYGNLKELKNLRFGYIPGETNSKWIMDLLENRDIKVIPVEAQSYKELDDLLMKNEIDATISHINNTKLSDMNEIFEYSTGPVYIAGNKKNKQLVKDIDSKLKLYSKQKYSPIDNLKDIYFNKGEGRDKSNFDIISLIVLSIVGFLSYIFYKKKLPYIKKCKMKKIIREDLKKNKYFLYYQPIVNPKKNAVIGFEGLLRFRKDNKILTPYFFIKDIENNDMLFETSLHILKLAINDYNIIKKYNNMKDDEFYISLNMSLNEIENDTFIKQICDISTLMNMKEHSICIEILEKVGINDLSKINRSIEKLKKCGFMIAIDDFGVEYSNLDILEKLDFDIVKIDKYFIDSIESSIFVKEIIIFLSNICKATNKSIVCEGVEYKCQKDFIKNIKNEKVYIQGYYYFKPLSINEINKINID